MSGSALFSYIQSLQGELPYGRLLDAGTGSRSLRWVMTLDTESWTAVTVDALMQRKVQRLAGSRQRPQDRLLLGNWTDPDFLAGEQFDTVLADYLLGAVEGFAPFFQSKLFERLRAVTGRRLYVTGVEPYAVERPADPAGTLIWEIGRYRDACLILLGKHPYRECPLEWVLEQLRSSGFAPVATRKFAIAYKADFVNGQIDLCRPALERLGDGAVRQALIAHGEELRSRTLAHIETHGSLRHGFAYVVAADAIG